MDRVVPEEIRRQLFVWNMVAAFHRVAYVVLGLVGALCPLIVASFGDALPMWQVRILSFAASASVAVFGAFGIGDLATRWRDAWKHLNAARLDFELGIIENGGLAKAYKEGEAIIGKMQPNPFPTATDGKK